MLTLTEINNVFYMRVSFNNKKIRSSFIDAVSLVAGDKGIIVPLVNANEEIEKSLTQYGCAFFKPCLPGIPTKYLHIILFDAKNMRLKQPPC